MNLENKTNFEDEEALKQYSWIETEPLDEDEMLRSIDEIVDRTQHLDNEIKVMKSEIKRVSHEVQAQEKKIKENTQKLKPCMAVIELLDTDPQDQGEEDGAIEEISSSKST